MADNENHSDELEQFFRNKADNYQIPFREDDWNKLEKRLDVYDLKIGYRRKLSLILAASLLIAGLLGYFTYQNYSQITELNQQLANELSIPPADSELPDPATPDPVSPITQIPEDEKPHSAMPDSDETILTAESPEPRDIMDADLQRQTTTDEIPGFETRIARAALPGIETDPAIHDISTLNLAVAELRDESKIAAERDSAHDFIEKPGQVSSRGLTAGLLLSPELSTVGSVSNFHDPGFRAGLSIEYELNQQFAISAGAVFSNVRYSTGQENYTAPQYINQQASERMIAECQIIDIPVGISYTFYRSERARFFSSASLSSYIMLNEDYYFFDDQSADPVFQQNERSGKMYWLSNAGFSLGYEHKISSTISLRAEPFIKAPLREVGWGNVRLYSIGSFFSVQYRM